MTVDDCPILKDVCTLVFISEEVTIDLISPHSLTTYPCGALTYLFGYKTYICNDLTSLVNYS